MKKLAAGLLAIAALSAHAEDAQGIWSGIIADQVKVVLTVSRAAGGSWEATLASPTQGFSTKVEQFATDPTHISFAIAKFNASYQATWNEKDKAWTGTWTQGRTAPLILQRIDAAGVAALQPKRPQESAIASASAPYASVDIQFASAALQLAGSLTLPRGAGPWPAVVLVHGSGPNNRDEEIFGHKIFLVLADHLARQGIAVLRYDKRGVGKSSGDFKAATTMDFAADAQAAFAFLRSRPEIDGRRIGLVGHSEGGLIAPIVAAREPQLGFIVMMAGPGVRGELLMVEQLALGSESDGAALAKLAKERTMNQALFAAIVGERDREQARIKALGILEQGERDGLLPPGMAAKEAASFTSPWFHAFLSLEPGVALQAVRQPVLALNGALDRQVPSKLDLDAIRAALAHNPRAVVKELPKLNHLFQTATTGAGDEYAAIEETLAPSALAVMADWIRSQVQ
ncbi:MAG: alpha/beta fold hydrolase [Pseudomonadota bacterium]